MPEASMTSNTWLPLVTLFGGFASSQILEWAKDHRAYRREKASRDEVRRDRLVEKRIEEQRQVLLDLQDAIFKLMQAASSAYSQDKNLYPTKATWEHNYRHEEITVANGEAQAKTMVLSVRVHDKAVRTMTQSLKFACVRIVEAKSRNESDTSFQQALALFVSVNERIGEFIRDSDSMLEAR